MGLLHRHKRTALATLALAVVGVGALAYWRSGSIARYTAGERTEGLVDRLGSGQDVADSPLRLREVAAERGLAFRHFPGTRSNRLPEDMGSGVALGDVDGDGWVDVFLANANGPMDSPVAFAGEAAASRLFLNRGGHFEDATASSGIDLRALAMAAAFVDVDSDADLDLFVTTYGDCRLWINDGNARFEEATERAGLAGYEGFWSGIGVADYDLDGAMDVYVCRYVHYVDEPEGSTAQYGVAIPAQLNPSTFEPGPNLLLKGRGDGTFEELAAQAGVDDPAGRGLGVLFCDLNGDGLPDLYVANDVSDNALLLNRGDGSFVDATSRSGIGDYRGAMGLSAADFDGDLDLDIFITHWVAQENALYRQVSRVAADDGGPALPVYYDEADRQRLGYQGLNMVGWATRLVDLDNDGLRDLFVVNGHTIPTAEDSMRLTPMTSQLFWNSGGKGRYVEVGAALGGFFAQEHVGRGGATFDFDLDGDEDILVVAHGGHAALLENEAGNARNVVRLRLRQAAGNRFAVGAQVTVQHGEAVAFDVSDTQGSYLSQHAVGELAFGLGEAGLVEEIEVRWPDGEVLRAGPFLANSLVDWQRGAPPRARPLPGRDALDRAGPTSVSSQRRFFELRAQARAAQLAGDPELAVRLYGQALGLWPGHLDALYYLGNAFLTTGDEAAALCCMQRLVHFEPGSSAGWMQIGLLRLPGGEPAFDDLALAREAFERCQAINSEESRPLLQLGIVSLLEGDLERAAECFAHVSRLNPASLEARWFAGRVAYLQGDREGAQRWLDQLRTTTRPVVAAPAGEGDTRQGSAMTAAHEVALCAELTRWRDAHLRSTSVEEEFVDLE